MPCFSVVVTNWNRGDSLAACVGSCLAQTGVEKLEVIIVDDASDDNSLEVATKLRQNHPDTIRVFETHESLTHNICLPANIGIKRARHDLVVINPSDTLQLVPYNFQAYAAMIADKGKVWAGPHMHRVGLQECPDWNYKKCAQNGGCTKREYLHKITGYDEHMYGWGSDEPDFYNRLKLIGVTRQQVEAWVLHLHVKLVGPKPQRKVGDSYKIDRENWEKKRFAPNNPETWGEHPKLEEIE